MSNNAPLILTAGRWTAFAAVLFVELAIIAEVSVIFGLTSGLPRPLYSDGEYLGKLDPAWLKTEWEWRRAAFPTQLASGFFFAFSLYLLSHAVLCLSKVYRGHKGSAQTALFGLFLFGSCLPATEFLQNLGSNQAGDRISQAVDEGRLITHGFSVLEISFTIENSRSLWLYSLVYVFIALGLLVNAFLAFKNEPKGQFVMKSHAAWGLFVAFCGFIVFGLELAAYFVPFLLKAYGICQLVYGAILLPSWTIWLGVILGRLQKPTVDKYHEEIEEVGMENLEDVDYDAMEGEKPAKKDAPKQKEVSSKASADDETSE